MINHLRTLSTRIITGWLPGARGLVVRAWAWLCVSTDDLGVKQRCVEAS